MHKVALVAFALAAATPAWASPDPYRYSGTHAGGPADDLISATGGRPKGVRKAYVNRAYHYGGTHAGGPADALISATGGRAVAVRRVYANPAYRYGGTHAGGPADALIPE